MMSDQEQRPDSGSPSQADKGITLAEHEDFQVRVWAWLQQCFGTVVALDRRERRDRFVEEALELAQACGTTRDEAIALVDYVYGRAQGKPEQEVGGVMLTLAALCLAEGMEMDQCGETELARVWTCMDKIRAKHARKPRFSPLPGTDEEEQ